MKMYRVIVTSKEVFDKRLHPSVQGSDRGHNYDGMQQDGCFYTSSRDVFANNSDDAIDKALAHAKRYVKAKEFEVTVKLSKVYI